MKQAVLLLAHGTVDELNELPEFATRIRRGHPAPPELITELRRRYDAIGGRSPLNAINGRLAARVAEVLGVPARIANRLARPFVKDVLAAMAEEGIEKVAVLPLAQYSVHVYAAAAQAAAAELARDGKVLTVVTARGWGTEGRLLDAYAEAIGEALRPIRDLGRTTLALTAHSLPLAVVRGGDPYEREFRAASAGVAARVEAILGRPIPHLVAFQSQGMSAGPGGTPVEWLGPDLRATIDAAAARGDMDVVFAPVGFLADHVEILYDLDIEARAWVEEKGMVFHRVRSLNDSAPLVHVLADLARPLLASAPGSDGA